MIMFVFRVSTACQLALGNGQNGAIVRIIRELGGDNVITFNISVTELALGGGLIEMRNEEFRIWVYFQTSQK